MKAPIKYPCLMLEKVNSFTNQLINYVIVRTPKQFYGYKKRFNEPVYTYDQFMLNEALRLENSTNLTQY